MPWLRPVRYALGWMEERRRPQDSARALAWRATAAALLVSGFALASCGPSTAPRGDVSAPDIVLITIDTLRADHLGAYGYPRDTSPNIDRLARDGQLFENCVSQAPETRPSLASLLTGFLPHETRVMDTHVLPEGVTTLAEILRARGHRSVAVTSNYVLKSAWGWSQGFEVYDDTMESRERVRGVPERTAKDTTDRAIALLERYHADPLFLWVHYEDPHAPYTPPGDLARLFDDPSQEPRPLRLNPGLSGQGGIPAHQQLDGERDYNFYVARYDAEVRYMDRELGRLLDALELLGLYDRALIVLTADHGEAMGEKDYYFAHIEQLFHGLLHVPLILRYGSELSGRRTDFVQLLDVLPTILAVAGIDSDPALRGRDLRAAPAGGVEIYSEQPSGPTPRRSLVVNGLKLVYEPDSDRYQLFDVRVDPGEARDLSAEPPYRQVAADLARRLASIDQQDRLKLAAPGAALPLTDAERERLRALGYAR